MNTKTLKPAVADGKIIEGYFVCPDGNIWSAKGKFWKKLSPSSCPPYPKVSLSVNRGKMKSFYAHRIVCESIHSFPIPDGVTNSEWKNTPDKIKKILSTLFQVNHIDHDHFNHHPSNLEWVTVKQNANKYQQHRTASY